MLFSDKESLLSSPDHKASSLGFLFNTQDQVSAANQKIQIIQEKIERAHSEYINCILDVNADFFATGSSDMKVNIWSKQTLGLIENFEVPGEVASMCIASNDQIVAGLINGGIAIIDAVKLQMSRVLERAHTGTVVSCISLR
jgi:WD40 repeat protein